MLQSVSNAIADSLLLLSLYLQSPFDNLPMVVSLSLLLYPLLKECPPVVQGVPGLRVLVVKEADDVWLRHEFLHFVAEILFSRILQAVQFLD